MESIDFKRLNLTIEEARDIINFIAQKRGISTEKLLSTIKPNLKRKNNEILTTKTQQNMAKTQQELIRSQKTQQELIKSQKTQQELRKSQQELIKSPQELRIHTRSVNEEFMNGSDTDEIIKELFRCLLQRYQENLQEKMKGSDFAFDGVNYLYYDLNKISISKGGSYIDSPKWLKDKKSTINPKNNDHKCFQYAVILALNYDKIDRNPQRISKIKPFIEEYNWKNTDFPSTSKDWKKFEINNEVALNILYVPHNTKKIEIAFKSKHNLTREKQIILLMISNGENWHYLVVKRVSGLLTGITSNHKEDFYCLNCFH